MTTLAIERMSWEAPHARGLWDSIMREGNRYESPAGHEQREHGNSLQHNLIESYGVLNRGRDGAWPCAT
jgi:hypothetical protein